MQALILASTSSYRRKLLERLGISFRVAAPDIDERRVQDEAPPVLAARLAREKAAQVAKFHPDALVIGSDQVAALEQQVLGKPGDHENARSQLLGCSGKSVQFYTAVCVLGNGDEQIHVDKTEVSFRNLSRKEIDAYIEKEKPFDCAGSFKAEGLGIVLFNGIHSEDPTALIGLPLIWLSQALRDNGFPLP